MLGGRLVAALAVVALAVPGASLPVDEPDEPLPVMDRAWADEYAWALVWSTTNKDTLVAALVGGAGMAGWARDMIAAYEDGQAWARHDLARADRALLLERVVDVAGAAAPLGVASVPEPFVAPLATVLGAQARERDVWPTLPHPEQRPFAFGHAQAELAGWMSGVLEVVIPEFRLAAGSSYIEEPILVDPVGLVILGGTGDDWYGVSSGDVRSTRPILVVEPGGHDEYYRDIATHGQWDVEALPPSMQVIDAPTPAIGIDLAGNDLYTRRVAHTGFGGTMMVDVEGDDKYGAFHIRRAIASANLGYAQLVDKEGDDEYVAKEAAFGWAILGVGVLADREGHDSYVADVDSGGAEVLGVGHNVGALAIVRDFAGDDLYRSGVISQGSANDDAFANFIDDSGDDTHFVHTTGEGSWGRKSVEEGGLQNAPTRRSLGHFVDGGGLDSYLYVNLLRPLDSFGNGVGSIAGGDGRRWGAFVDCSGTPDPLFPCAAEHEALLEDIVGDP